MFSIFGDVSITIAVALILLLTVFCVVYGVITWNKD